MKTKSRWVEVWFSVAFLSASVLALCMGADDFPREEDIPVLDEMAEMLAANRANYERAAELVLKHDRPVGDPEVARLTSTEDGTDRVFVETVSAPGRRDLWVRTWVGGLQNSGFYVGLVYCEGGDPVDTKHTRYHHIDGSWYWVYKRKV